MRRLVESGNIVIGTIRAAVYDQFRPSADLRPLEWDVISVFEHVFLSRVLSQKEERRVARAINDNDMQNRIRAVGLGEHHPGAAQQVADTLKLGAAGINSLGYALVLAAADWRRCGMTRPIPLTMLTHLAKPHLSQRDQVRMDDEDSLSSGIAWATREINPNVALLQSAGNDSYSIYEYAVDLVSAQNIPITEENWDFIIANASIAELIRVGYTAEIVYNRTETADIALGKAIGSGDPELVPLAAYYGGLLMERHGMTQAGRRRLRESRRIWKR